MANSCGIIGRVNESEGIRRLQELVATRKQLSAKIDALLEELLRDGEYVEDVAAALGESREKVRNFRKARDIPDARDIRREKGTPLRRPAAT